MWRDKGLVALLRRIRLMALLRLHYAFWDRGFERHERVPTIGVMRKRELAPEGTSNLSQAHEYAPSPRLVVYWLLDGLGEDLSRFSFVDYGSGRGRVLLAAAERPLRAVRGIELSARLHGEAARNISGYPKRLMACADVRSVCGDALEFVPPEGDCILYFYNPFDAGLMDRVVRRAMDILRKRDSRMIAIYYNATQHETLAAIPGLEPGRLSPAARLKLLLFSPYRARVYEMIPERDRSGTP